jgi:hypothetical protein
MNTLFIGVIQLLLFMFASRAINESANKKLNKSKQAQLVEVFSKTRIYTLGVIIALLALLFFLLQFGKIERSLTIIIYGIVIFTFLAVSAGLSYRKLKQFDFPQAYLKSFLLATALRVVGLIVFIFVVMYT